MSIMNEKQLVDFVTDMQEEMMKTSVNPYLKHTEKYEYECRKVISLYIDWEIRRKLTGTNNFTLWALHNKRLKVWIFYDSNNMYQYTDTDLVSEVRGK